MLFSAMQSDLLPSALKQFLKCWQIKETKKEMKEKHSYTIINIFLHEMNVNISNFIPPSPQSPSNRVLSALILC